MSLQYNSNRDTDYIDLRSGLYYNQYLYRATVRVPRGSWFKNGQTRDQFLDTMHGLALSRKTLNMLDGDPTLYERWWDWCSVASIRPSTLPQMRSEGRKTALYSNDLALLQSLHTVDSEGLIISRAVNMEREPGVRYYRTTPKHKYRVYLRGGRVPRTEFNRFTAFLQKHSEHMHMSPGLRRAVRRDYDVSSFPYTWASSSYFINFDDPKVECWLQLAWSDLLGKYYELRRWEKPEHA